MSSVGQLQAEMIGRPGLIGLWIFGLRKNVDVLGVVTKRLRAVEGSFCSKMSLLTVSLTIF